MMDVATLENLQQVLNNALVIVREWQEKEEKPECPCADGIDSKACAGCPQDEARKLKRIEERASKFGEVCVRPEYDDEKCKKCNECIEGPDYRPFKDCDELIEFWTKNYQTVLRPANTKPLIWVRLKCDKRERLIVAFGTDFVEIGNKAKAVTLQKLFENYEFLDGAVCGVKND